jgi:hypothetical protein
MKAMEQDVLVMRKGKLMRIRQGQEQPVDLVVTLANGGRVAMDGTLTLPDGTSRMLMDGEAITLDGEPTTLADLGLNREDRGEGIEE